MEVCCATCKHFEVYSIAVCEKHLGRFCWEREYTDWEPRDDVKFIDEDEFNVD